MHRNDPFAQSIPVTAFPRCAAVRIQPVKEKHEYFAAPDRGGIVPERRFRPCFPRNTFPAALMQQRGVDLQPLFPRDRKGGVMVFPLRFIKKGTCQINVHTRHPVTDFSVKSNRRAYSDGGFAVAPRAGGADAAAYRAERRAAIFCAAVRTPRAGGADAAAYRAERKAAIFCAAVRTPQTGDVICLRADEPAAPTRQHTVRSAEPQYFVRQSAPRRRATSYASAPMNPRRRSANAARLQRKNGTYRPVF